MSNIDSGYNEQRKEITDGFFECKEYYCTHIRTNFDRRCRNAV